MFRIDNVIGAKVRALYGRRIRDEQLLEMSRRSSVGDLAAYLLDETAYGGLLSGSRPAHLHRGQLEGMLKACHYARCRRLINYTKGRRGFFSYITEEFEIQNILLMLRLINAGHPEKFIPYYTDISAHTKGLRLSALPEVRTLTELMDFLRDTPYFDILTPCILDGARFDRCEAALYTYYYNNLGHRINTSFRGREREQLLSVFDIYTALSNIGAVLRIKRYFPHIPPAEIPDYFLPSGEGLSPRFWNKLCAAESPEAAAALVQGSRFGKYINSSGALQDPDIIRIRGRLCRKLLRYSTCNEVIFSAYIVLDLLEIANITVILEGVRYGLDPSEIQKMIIFEQEHNA